MNTATTPRLLRRPQVEELTGLPRTTIYELVRKGQFPPPVPLVGRTVAWPEPAVREWIESRIAGKGAA